MFGDPPSRHRVSTTFPPAACRSYVGMDGSSSASPTTVTPSISTGTGGRRVRELEFDRRVARSLCGEPERGVASEPSRECPDRVRDGDRRRIRAPDPAPRSASRTLRPPLPCTATPTCPPRGTGGAHRWRTHRSRCRIPGRTLGAEEQRDQHSGQRRMRAPPSLRARARRQRSV